MAVMIEVKFNDLTKQAFLMPPGVFLFGTLNHTLAFTA
jgi:hypothetical protein